MNSRELFPSMFLTPLIQANCLLAILLTLFLCPSGMSAQEYPFGTPEKAFGAPVEVKARPLYGQAKSEPPAESAEDESTKANRPSVKMPYDFSPSASFPSAPSGNRNVLPAAFASPVTSRVATPPPARAMVNGRSFPLGHFDWPANWGDYIGPVMPPRTKPSGRAELASSRDNQSTSRNRPPQGNTPRANRAGGSRAGTGAFTPRTPDQNLVHAVQLAREGKPRQGASLASKTYRSESFGLEFSFRYIDALVAISEFTNSKNEIINPAIKVAGSIHKKKLANGRKNVDLSFKFAKTLRGLGDSVADISPKIASKLLIAEGEIASNLVRNDEFPVAAQRGLAESFFNHARGLAIASSGNDVTASLHKAFELGFTGFDRVLTEPAFMRLETAGDVSMLVNMHRSKQVVQVGDWARNQLASFRPFDFELDERNVVDGSRILDSDYIGKILVVDIWATWCEPCRRQIPHLVRLQNEMKSRGVRVVGVSLDNPRNRQEAGPIVRRFAKTNQLNYPNVLGSPRFKAGLPDVKSLPSTLIVDRRGRVRLVLDGYQEYHQIETVIDLLSKESPQALEGTPTVGPDGSDAEPRAAAVPGDMRVSTWQ